MPLLPVPLAPSGPLAALRKQRLSRSSRCGAVGLPALLQRQGVGSIPGLTQGFRIRCCCGCRVGLGCSSDLTPGLGTSACCRCGRRRVQIQRVWADSQPPLALLPSSPHPRSPRLSSDGAIPDHRVPISPAPGRARQPQVPSAGFPALPLLLLDQPRVSEATLMPPPPRWLVSSPRLEGVSVLVSLLVALSLVCWLRGRLGEAAPESDSSCGQSDSCALSKRVFVKESFDKTHTCKSQCHWVRSSLSLPLRGQAVMTGALGGCGGCGR